MSRACEFDLVVHGATGYTGRLVVEHLVRSRAPGLSWAMSGRSLEKLAAVRDAAGAPGDTPLLAADAADDASLAALAARTRIVITTAGPFQLYGSGLVAACARAGTDYLDLSGETAWMRAMIEAHERDAQRSGARILFSCGFDSIPFELGVFRMQALARAAFGAPVARAKSRVLALRGSYSGGTIASGQATAEAAARDPAVLALLLDPFSLTPGFRGPPQPSGAAAEYDADVEAWVAPFVMAPINTRNVHRSNLLQGHAYGEDFTYDEMLVAGPGEAGRAAAEAIAAAPQGQGGEDMPAPGEGPSPEERAAGSYDVLVIGTAPHGRQVRVAVHGDMDPGYGSTSKIIAETALCLRERGGEVSGGMWTPGAALGDALIDRLQARAGLTFRAEPA